MWELTTSHRTLRLRLEQPGRAGNLVIACLEPEFIQGPTEWRDSHVEITRERDGFSIKDQRAGVDVHAGHVELAENTKPLNAFTVVSDEMSNREDPLQVSGDIVNTRPSGTKPR